MDLFGTGPVNEEGLSEHEGVLFAQMRSLAWWLLPVIILSMGCPGPEDRKKLETISSFEMFIDRFMSEISPDLKNGQGFLLVEDGGAPGTAWTLSLYDYMVRPLTQPADSWLGEIHFTLKPSGEECSPTSQPVELYVDFVGDTTRWTFYSAASRPGTVKNLPNEETWRVWEPDTEDWLYLTDISRSLALEKTPPGKSGSAREVTE